MCWHHKYYIVTIKKKKKLKDPEEDAIVFWKLPPAQFGNWIYRREVDQLVPRHCTWYWKNWSKVLSLEFGRRVKVQRSYPIQDKTLESVQWRFVLWLRKCSRGIRRRRSRTSYSTDSTYNKDNSSRGPQRRSHPCSVCPGPPCTWHRFGLHFEA